MKKTILYLLLVFLIAQTAKTQTTPDSTVVHGLRELTTDPDAYTPTDHTGIANTKTAELITEANKLRDLVKDIAPGFKVFDYGSYPMLTQMGKEADNTSLFADMEAKIALMTNPAVPNYLLIGKHIDSETGKVSFKVRVKMPVTGNKGTLDDSTNTGNKIVVSLTQEDLEDIEKTLENYATYESLDQQNPGEKGHKGTNSALKKGEEIFTQVKENRFQAYFFTPSGKIIRIHPDKVIAANSQCNGSLYGFTFSNKLRYVADISNGIFYGYMRVDNIDDSSIVEYYNDTNTYNTTTPVSVALYKDIGHCTLEYYYANFTLSASNKNTINGSRNQIGETIVDNSSLLTGTPKIVKCDETLPEITNSGGSDMLRSELSSKYEYLRSYLKEFMDHKTKYLLKENGNTKAYELELSSINPVKLTDEQIKELIAYIDLTVSAVNKFVNATDKQSCNWFTDVKTYFVRDNRILSMPFKKLSFQDRINMINCMTQNTVSSGDREIADLIIMATIENVPSFQSQQFYESIKNGNYIGKMLSTMNSDIPMMRSMAYLSAWYLAFENKENNKVYFVPVNMPLHDEIILGDEFKNNKIEFNNSSSIGVGTGIVSKDLIPRFTVDKMDMVYFSVDKNTEAGVFGAFSDEQDSLFYRLPAFGLYALRKYNGKISSVKLINDIGKIAVVSISIATLPLGIGEIGLAAEGIETAVSATALVSNGFKLARGFITLGLDMTGIAVETLMGDSQAEMQFKATYYKVAFIWGTGLLLTAGYSALRTKMLNLIETRRALAISAEKALLDEIEGICKGKCFLGGTLIAEEHGSRLIENIKENDKVWSWDFGKKAVSLQRVVRTFKHTSNQIVHLFIGKDTIHTTPEHPFYVPQQEQIYTSTESDNIELSEKSAWVLAKNLKKGMKVFLLSSLLATVDSTFAQDTVCTVYNFEVENTHNYFVGKEKILVHNLCWANFLKKTFQEQKTYIKDLWKQKFYTGNKTQFFGARRELEEIMHNAYYGPQGYKTTSDIATNFKAIDHYDEISEIGNIISAREVVSTKTTVTAAENAETWWKSKPIQDNIDELEKGLKNNTGILWAGKRIKYPKVKIHLVVEEGADIAKWKIFFKEKSFETGFKFEVSTIEKLITP